MGQFGNYQWKAVPWNYGRNFWVFFIPFLTQLSVDINIQTKKSWHCLNLCWLAVSSGCFVWYDEPKRANSRRCLLSIQMVKCFMFQCFKMFQMTEKCLRVKIQPQCSKGVHILPVQSAFSICVFFHGFSFLEM